MRHRSCRLRLCALHALHMYTYQLSNTSSINHTITAGEKKIMHNHHINEVEQYVFVYLISLPGLVVLLCAPKHETCIYAYDDSIHLWHLHGNTQYTNTTCSILWGKYSHVSMWIYVQTSPDWFHSISEQVYIYIHLLTTLTFSSIHQQIITNHSFDQTRVTSY